MQRNKSIFDIKWPVAKRLVRMNRSCSCIGSTACSDAAEGRTVRCVVFPGSQIWRGFELHHQVILWKQNRMFFCVEAELDLGFLFVTRKVFQH